MSCVRCVPFYDARHTIMTYGDSLSTNSGELHSVGEIILLRRISKIAAPYFWGVVDSGNVRFQFFVPMCPADSHWFLEGQATTLQMMHYPSKFPLDWQFGELKYGMMNWGEKIQSKKLLPSVFMLKEPLKNQWVLSLIHI